MRASFSVLVPADGDDVALDATLESLRQQETGVWELLCVGAGERERDVLALDDRAWALPAEGGAAERLNHALATAVGSHVMVLDPGDRLRPTALGEITAALAARDGAGDVLVVDESCDDGEGGDDFRKPTWSPEYLRGHCWTGRGTVLRAAAVRAAGGFRPEVEGAHEWDLVLRVTERRPAVRRVRSVQVDRRGRPSSGLGEDLRAQAACVRAVEEHLARTGVDAQVEPTGEPGYLRVRRAVPQDVLVSVVVPTVGTVRDVRGTPETLVLNALRSMNRFDAGVPWELVCVIDQAAEPALEELVRQAAGDRPVRVVRPGGDFSFARAMNLGVHAAAGDRVLMLNDDVEVLRDGWLRRMVEATADPTVGAVGATLLFEDGRVQHAGVFGDANGLPYHAHLFEQPTGYRGSLRVPLEYLAVTGACLMVRRELFVAVGGLHQGLPLNFQDVDFCLKLALKGYRNVLVPDVRLVHFESSSRKAVVQDWEIAQLRRRWRGVLDLDPYFHRSRLVGFDPGSAFA